MDLRLPDGWERVQDSGGKFFYLTRPPRVKIVSRNQLEFYHQRGRYQEMKVDDLDFGGKMRRKKFSVVGPTENPICETEYLIGYPQPTTQHYDKQASLIKGGDDERD